MDRDMTIPEQDNVLNKSDIIMVIFVDILPRLCVPRLTLLGAI